MSRLVLVVAASLSAAGCTLSYPLRTEVRGAHVLAVREGRQPPSCLSTIHVFARPLSERQARIGPDAPPIWSVNAAQGYCIAGFPTFIYGEVPEGMAAEMPPPPLEPGRTYWIRGYTTGAVYSGSFTAPAGAPGR